MRVRLFIEIPIGTNGLTTKFNLSIEFSISSHILNMPESIKLFSFIRKYFHLYGFYPPQLNENGPALNSRNWIFIIGDVQMCFSSAAFFIVEAESMLEYGLSFFLTNASESMGCVFIAIIWRMKNIWLFFESCERFIQRSK